jgi:hypothetical protein
MEGSKPIPAEQLCGCTRLTIANEYFFVVVVGLFLKTQ